MRAEMPEDFYQTSERVKADSSGYIQGVDAEALIDIATEYDLLIRMRHRPGDFVSEGDALLLAWPAGNVGDEACRRLQVAFAWGHKRTALQDARFLVNELVEIAARALSPGVNDPFTANSCLDWLSASLKDLAERDFPDAGRYDEHGTLRIVAEPTSFEEFVGHVYGQLRPYVSADRNAALHALKTIGEVGGRATNERQRHALRHEADAILQGAHATLALEADKEAVERRHRVVVHLLSGHVNYEEAASDDGVDRRDGVRPTA